MFYYINNLFLNMFTSPSVVKFQEINKIFLYNLQLSLIKESTGVLYFKIYEIIRTSPKSEAKILIKI